MAQPAEFQTQTPPTDLPVGEVLRRTRIHYDKSIRDIQDALHIRADQIEAIEQGDTEKLLARVYAIGFVRSYSEFLGLDGAKMVELYKAQSTGVSAEPVLDFSVTADDSKAPPLWFALICFVTFLLGITFYLTGQASQRESIETVPEVPPALSVETLEEKQKITPPPQESLSDAAEPAPAPAKEPARKGISLNIKENSWVEIRNAEGKALLSRVLKAGEKYFIPERANLTMSVGNAGGIEVEVNGEPLGTDGSTLGPKGQVMRQIPLNGDALKQRFVEQGAQKNTSQNASQSTNPIENLSR